MITDNFVINYFYDTNGKPICSRFRKNSINRNFELVEYLKNRFDTFISYNETIYRIKYNIEETPKCHTCGRPTNTLANGKIRKYCSYKCMNSNKEKIKMGVKSSKERFGDKNYNNREKYRKTNLEKFGTDHPWKNKKILEKCFETSYNRYNERYYFNKKEVKDKALKLAWSSSAINKRNSTNLEKFGNTIPSKTKLISNKLKEILNNPEIEIKKHNTKIKNNSYAKSKSEDKSFLLLKEKYNEVLRQYRSEQYPFNCDFYIPSKDLYIECNYFWTHGKFPYIEAEQKCIEKLNNWKSKNTKFYNNAINVWTISDVKKRNIAKEKQLNWIEFFNINELKNWLNGN